MFDWERSPALASMRCERAWIEIDHQALAENVRQIRALLAPETALMAVVKADAYGHGAIAIARTALQSGASWLGVATIPEGIELREAGIRAPILVLGATHTAEQVRAIAHWQLQPILCTAQQALTFSAALPEQALLPVHIHIDTGMSRLGVPWEQAADLIGRVSQLPRLQIAGLSSHLATADSPDPTLMRLQQTRFEQVLAQIPITSLRQPSLGIPQLHLANSAATLTDTHFHYDMVRVGLALYGLYPAPHLRQAHRDTLRLRPVMQVKARITQIKTIAAGTGVSYGYRFVADRPTRVAVVGVGYADGVPRNLSQQMTALVQGRRIPQIGAITMDQMMFDVSQMPHLQEGEVVTLLGQSGTDCISADDWANQLGTISWEILCGFKHRLPRVTTMTPANLHYSSVIPPHPPTPSPTRGEGEPVKVPLPTWERDLG